MKVLKPVNVFIIVLIFWMSFFSLCFATQFAGGNGEFPKLFSMEDLSTQSISPDPIGQLNKMAEQLLKQGKFKQAYQYARAILAKEPENIPAQKIVGVIYALSGAKEKAVKALEALDQKNSKAIHSNLIRAMLAAQDKQYSIAQKHLDQCLLKEPDHPLAVYYQGSLFLVRDNYQKAIQYFDKVIGIEPDFVPALAGLGQAYLLLKKKDQATEYYEKAVHHQPENMMYRQQLLQIYKDLGNKDLANNQIKEMLYYTPGVKQEYLKKGRQLLSLGAYEDADKLMDRIIGVYKDIPLAFYIKAVAGANLKQAPEAVEYIERFLVAHKNSPLAHHYAGMCFMALEMYSQAEEQFKKVISIDPTIGKSFVPMTVIEQINGNFERALQGLDLAKNGGEPFEMVDFLSAHIYLQQNKEDQFYQLMENGAQLVPGLKLKKKSVFESESDRDFFCRSRNLMVIFFYNGWYGRTLEISDALMDKNPKDPISLYYKALCHTVRNETHNAINAYRKLADLEKGLIAAHMGIGRLYMAVNETEKAQEAFETAIKSEPSFGPAYAGLGDLFMGRAKFDRAIEYYQKTLEISPQAVPVYAKLIILLTEEEGRKFQAVQYAEKLEAMSPEDPYSLDAIGWTKIAQKQYEKGDDLIRKAHSLSPNDPLILYHMGVLNYQEKNLTAAHNYLERALKNASQFPGHKNATQLFEKLRTQD